MRFVFVCFIGAGLISACGGSNKSNPPDAQTVIDAPMPPHVDAAGADANHMTIDGGAIDAPSMTIDGGGGAIDANTGPDATPTTCTSPADCNDGNACTTDGCDASGVCTHTPVATDDMNACTTDSCDPTTGVAHTPVA